MRQIGRMLYEANTHHPADPQLVVAVRESLQQARLESEYLVAVMTEAAQARPDFMGGETVVLPSGQMHDFVPPDRMLKMGATVAAFGEALLEDLEKASTIEAQQQHLLQTMREAVYAGLVGGASPYPARCLLDTIDLCFEHYTEQRLPRSRALLDVENNVRFYMRICYDALNCSEALTHNIEDNMMPDHEHCAVSPYDLAYLRATRNAPLDADKHAKLNEGSMLTPAATNIFVEMIEPYRPHMPSTISLDMLGLIQRCSEQVADRMYEEHAPPRRGQRVPHADNDQDGPETTVALMRDPLVRRRVCSILGAVFDKHPDAAQSPENMMEASVTLEEMLARDAQLHARGGMRR